MAEFKKREQINLPYFNAQTDAVVALDFSFDARYLAVAYSNGADVWDLDKTNTIPISTTHGRRVTGRIRSLAWFPTRHRLILAHDSGVVYVVTFGINSVATAGVREPGFHQNAVSIAVLNDNLFAVAFTKTVQIRYKRPGSQGMKYLAPSKEVKLIFPNFRFSRRRLGTSGLFKKPSCDPRVEYLESYYRQYTHNQRPTITCLLWQDDHCVRYFHFTSIV